MSPDHSKDRTDLFTVVGAPHISEHHTDSYGHYRADPEASAIPPEASIAALWLVLYAAIFGLTLYAHDGIGRAFDVAMNYLN